MSTLTPEALHQAGLDALRQSLGVVGMVRFLQQIEAGKGDYTAERWQWLPENEDIEKLAEEANRAMAAYNGRPKAD